MTDEVRDRFHADLRSRREQARSLLPLDHQAEFDAFMEHVASERHGMGMLWASLSPAQRSLVGKLRTRERTVVLGRFLSTRYDATDATGTTPGIASASTVRALVARKVLRWVEGGVGDGAAVLDVRGTALMAFLDGRT